MSNKNQHSRAHKLLLEYRLMTCRKSALETVPGINNKALPAYRKQIHFTDELAAALKSDKRFGDKLYWIIYITYLSTRQLNDVEEILDDIACKYERIPRRTYFRLRKRAVEIMDNHLNNEV